LSDFTKDELQILSLEMSIVINRITKEGLLQIPPIYFELRDKIQSMIDNHVPNTCQHDWIKCFYSEEFIPINLCRHCNLREKR